MPEVEELTFFPCGLYGFCFKSMSIGVSWYNDGWMSWVWAAHPVQPILATSTHQKTLFATVILSLLHFTQNIKVHINSFCAKSLQLTVIGWNKSPYGTERIKHAKTMYLWWCLCTLVHMYLYLPWIQFCTDVERHQSNPVPCVNKKK
jgi:hypothetical protein